MRKQWDQAKKAFLCAYTGLSLTTDWSEDGRAGPLHATWEHRDPRDPNKASQVVLVAWLVNDMKNDLNEREFKNMVRALAARFLAPKVWRFNRRALPKEWYRLRSLPPK
jgi:hypothetical protein